jgi:flagellar operon protein (TIGR03826 family)
MSTQQLGNCSKCGKLFVRLRDLCNDCYQKQEDDYLLVASFLRDYSGTTIQELSDATKVSIAQIRQFILAKRILIGQFTNLSYPCEMCGSMIQTGRTCTSCLASLNQLLRQVEKKEPGDETNRKPGGYITTYL